MHRLVEVAGRDLPRPTSRCATTPGAAARGAGRAARRASPVYRAYVVPGEPAAGRRRAGVVAAAAARRAAASPRTGTTRWTVVGGSRSVRPRPTARSRDEFVVRFQQTCGPVMAKGVEDTAFYRWLRLTALNEVGGDPAHLGVAAGRVARLVRRGQQAHWPDGDDHAVDPRHQAQRGRPGPARRAVRASADAERVVRGGRPRWRAATAAQAAPRSTATPSTSLWQTLVGAWPIDRTAARLAYLEKAIREAKRHTTLDRARRGVRGARCAASRRGARRRRRGWRGWTVAALRSTWRHCRDQRARPEAAAADHARRARRLPGLRAWSTSAGRPGQPAAGRLRVRRSLLGAWRPGGTLDAAKLPGERSAAAAGRAAGVVRRSVRAGLRTGPPPSTRSRSSAAGARSPWRRGSPTAWRAAAAGAAPPSRCRRAPGSTCSPAGRGGRGRARRAARHAARGPADPAGLSQAPDALELGLDVEVGRRLLRVDPLQGLEQQPRSPSSGTTCGPTG